MPIHLNNYKSSSDIYTQDPNLSLSNNSPHNSQALLETIVQWNINSYFRKLTDVHRLISDFQPLALCLQETNLKYQNNNPSIRNYHGYFKNRVPEGRASGGVCIFVSNSTEHKIILLNTAFEAIAVVIRTNYNKKICICNLYAPDSIELSLKDLQNLIIQLPRPFILLGDFNSRNIIWGSSYTDRRGKTVEKLLDDDSIVLLNDGSPTRHNAANNNFSAIDLSIASASLGGSIDWSVQTAYSSNDHWPITLRLLKSQPIDKEAPKWLLKTANWPEFSIKVDKLLEDIHFDTLLQPNSLENIDTIVEIFTNTIIEAAKLPYTKPNQAILKKRYLGGMMTAKQRLKITKKP
jgi:hypothetical protein